MILKCFEKERIFRNTEKKEKYIKIYKSVDNTNVDYTTLMKCIFLEFMFFYSLISKNYFFFKTLRILKIVLK